jgi:small-conductance mechanosensitive channel
MTKFDWESFIAAFGVSDIVLACVIASLIIAFYFVNHLVLKKTDKKDSNLLILFFHNFSGPIQVFFILTALFILFRNLPLQLQEQQWFGNVYSIALISLFGWSAMRAVGLASDLFLKRFDMEVKNNLQARQMHTQVKVMKRLAGAIIILLTIALALMTFEEIRSLGVSLLASAGVAGIVIGLAAQKTIGNFFTGLQIAITQPIRLGDAVIVENEWGWIEEINLTYVVLKIWDQRRLILPISYFVDHPFQNWTRTTADLLGTIVLYLDYTTPLDDLRNELTRILENEGKELWDGRVNVIQVIDTSEKTMTVRALVSAADSPTAWNLRCLCREKLIDFLQKKYPESLPRVRADIPDLAKTA